MWAWEELMLLPAQSSVSMHQEETGGKAGDAVKPTVLELRMVILIALKSQKQKYIVYSLKPKMLYTVWKQNG